MKTYWNSELNLQLTRAVEKAVKCGFHTTQGPKRSDKVGKLLFWDTVAVLMAKDENSPTPGACSKQFPIALAEVQERAKVTGEVDLAQWDETYKTLNEVGAGDDDYVQYGVETLMNDNVAINDKLDALYGLLGALCDAWDVKMGGNK